MSIHREEGSFTIRIELSAEFDDAYEGDDDGLAWLHRWTATTRERAVRAVFDALRSDRAFDVVPSSRGASPDAEAHISLRFRGGDA